MSGQVNYLAEWRMWMSCRAAYAADFARSRVLSAGRGEYIEMKVGEREEKKER